MSLKDNVEALLSKANTYEDFNASCKQVQSAKATLEAFNALNLAQVKKVDLQNCGQDTDKSAFGSSWSGYKTMQSDSQWNRA